MIRWPSGALLPNSRMPHGLSSISCTEMDALGHQLGVVGIRIIDAEIREVVVGAELAGRHVVRALAKHDHAGVLGDDDLGQFGDDREV